MAIDLELNLFTSDPRLLVRAEDAAYERAAEALSQLADPDRLRLLHALTLGEDTPQRAAVCRASPCQSSAQWMWIHRLDRLRSVRQCFQ